MMDEAGIGRAFLVAAKIGQLGLQGSWHPDPRAVVDLVQWRPERFSGPVGHDPTQGMEGVREYGVIGAHGHPHRFELPPDHARWYSFDAARCEPEVPIPLQVGQSLVHEPKRPLRSVGQPVTLDAVACDLPGLRLVGIHVGIPWHDETIAMAREHRNVFIVADAQAPKHWPAGFVRCLDSCGQDKVMFGTDLPVLGFKRMREEVAALGLRPGPLRKFLRDNALRVYRLGG